MSFARPESDKGSDEEKPELDEDLTKIILNIAREIEEGGDPPRKEPKE
jgi:hypothetical protein